VRVTRRKAGFLILVLDDNTCDNFHRLIPLAGVKFRDDKKLCFRQKLFHNFCHSRAGGNRVHKMRAKRTKMQHFKEYNFWVYILFNERAKATYIGMTSCLERRILEHKRESIDGYTKEKHIHKLAYYEHFKYVDKAIAREKALKKWNRAWKYRLIETTNPNWDDLAAGIDWKLNPDELVKVFLEKLEKRQVKIW